jgi:lipopolysaccharide export system permease protein
MTGQRKLPIGSRLDRYVGAHFFGSYCAALGLMVGMIVILDLAGKVERYFEPWKDGTQVPFNTVLRYVMLNIPYQFLQIAPFVTLAAGMFTVNRLLRKNEVVAMLSAGVSVHRLLLSVYIGGVAMALGMFALREGVRFGFAEERDALRDMLSEQRHERVIGNLVVRDVSGSIVVLDRFYPGSPGAPEPRVEGLHVRQRQGDTYSSIRASGATWVGSDLMLEDGWRQVVSEEESEVEQVHRLVGVDVTPSIALTYNRAQSEPLELTFSEVEELVRREPDNPAWQTLWHYHLTFALANLVLLLVGLPLMFDFERGGGSERMALGGLLCVFYFCIDFVLRGYGLSGGLSPILASWLPVLFFGSLGAALVDSVRT